MKHKERYGKRQNIERVRLYALGDNVLSQRIKAAAALSGLTMEEFVTDTVTAKVDQILEPSIR